MNNAPVNQRPNVPAAESLTDMQVNTVLSVLNSLQPYLLLTQREIDTGMKPELDGGVPCAALSTFVTACSRLDALLNDASRWDGLATGNLMTAMTEHYDSATKFNDSQTATHAELHRPSRRLQPRFTTIGQEFIAVWGDAQLPGGQILGRGKTPAEALLDFDAAFNRAVGEQLRFAAASEDRVKAMQAEQAERVRADLYAKKSKRNRRK